MLAVWTLLQDGSGSDPGGLGWFSVVLLVLIIAAVIAYARISGKRLAESEAYLKEHNFRSVGKTLPPSLAAPSSVWFPQLTISDCYVGSRNDFEVAIFQMTMPQGEGSLVQTMVAVRRPPFGEVKLGCLLADMVKIDSTSTPGWIVASMKGKSRRPQVLEALLRALTAREEHGGDALDEHPTETPL